MEAVSVGDAALISAGFDVTLPNERSYSLLMSWSGKKFDLSVSETDTVEDLKHQIWSLTGVPPVRQKLIGIVKGKMPVDSETVSKLGLNVDAKKAFMMVGTPEGEEVQGQPTHDNSEAVHGLTIDAAFYERNRIRTVRKLKETAEKLSINMLSQPREGKRLLVIDLDYCILDSALWKEENFTAAFFARPFLHQLLEAINPYYDIVFWSQTSWRWLEQKLLELHILGEERKGDYNVLFVLDRSPMFTIFSEREGKPFKHEVKALPLIWGRFPQYNSHNTLHIDDLGRNFALNPNNGIKVKPYRDATFSRFTDRELIYVARYLLQLTFCQDVAQLKHKDFRKFEGPLPEGAEDPLTWKLPDEDM